MTAEVSVIMVALLDASFSHMISMVQHRAVLPLTYYVQSCFKFPLYRNYAPLPVTSVGFSRESIFRFRLNNSASTGKIPRN
jgi:hypothetical protein